MKRESPRKKTLPLWRREQVAKKRKRLVAFSRFFLAFFLIICGLGLVRQVFRTLSTPLGDRSCWSERLDLKKINRINVIFKSNLIFLASLDRDSRVISFLAMPPDMYLELVSGGGLNQLRGVYELGEANFGCGGGFSAETAQEFLGIPIDGYVEIPNAGVAISSQENARTFVGKLQSVKWMFRPRSTLNWVLGNVKTNLSLWEMGRLWWEIKKVRFDKIFFVSLEEREILMETVLPSGDRGKIADQVLLDEVVKEYFIDSQVRREALGVEVFNAAGRSGLGKKVGRFITNLGADLVNVGNFDRRIEKTKIFVIRKGLMDSYTVSRLAQVFKAEVERKEWEQARGDLAIVVGEDYSKRIGESLP